MKTVTIKTSCIAQVDEIWTFAVPDDWERGDIEDDELIEVLGDTPGAHCISCEDEVSDEHDRTVNDVEVL